MYSPFQQSFIPIRTLPSGVVQNLFRETQKCLMMCMCVPTLRKL